MSTSIQCKNPHTSFVELSTVFFTVRNSSCGKVMLSQECVTNSVHRGEVYTPLGIKTLCLKKNEIQTELIGANQYVIFYRLNKIVQFCSVFISPRFIGHDMMTFLTISALSPRIYRINKLWTMTVQKNGFAPLQFDSFE